jgi:hypothetical protein
MWYIWKDRYKIPIKKTFCDNHGRYNDFDTQKQSFLEGNHTGWKNRIDILASLYGDHDDWKRLPQMALPVNTTDNYKQYLVGFANGSYS